MPSTLVDPGQVGLVSQAVDVDRLIGYADADGDTLVEFFYALGANPGGGGTTIIEINDGPDGQGGGANGVTVTIADGELQANVTGSLAIAASQPVYRRVTQAPAGALNLAGTVSAFVTTGGGAGPVPQGGDLCAIADVKERLDFSDTTHDALLASLISQVSVAAQSYMGRIITAQSWDDWFYPSRRSTAIVLHAYPATITQVDENEITLTSSDYRLEGRDARMLRRLSNLRPAVWGERVNIQWVSGYSVIPDDIQGAVARQVQHEFNLYQASDKARLGLTSKITNIGGTESFEGDDLLPGVKRILAPYRRRY